MKKSDFEMLSEEELMAILNDSASFSEAEIICAKDILRERKSGSKGKDIAVTSRNDEIPGYSKDISNKGWSTSDIRELKGNIRTIKCCAVFFVALTIIGMVIGFMWISEFMENLSKFL